MKKNYISPKLFIAPTAKSDIILTSDLSYGGDENVPGTAQSKGREGKPIWDE